MASLDQLFEKMEHRIHDACAETCDAVPPEKWAQLGGAVHSALELFKCEVLEWARTTYGPKPIWSTRAPKKKAKSAASGSK